MDRVLATLEAEGALSDARFVEGYIRDRIGRGFGPLKVQQELRNRGIEARLIRERLEAGGDDWVSRVRKLRRDRFGEPLPSQQPERARQARFLHSRGFTEEQIRRALSS